MFNRNAFISEHGALSSPILLNIAEILTIRLPEGNERIVASKWVKKFLVCQPADYKHFLSLFIACLTKQVLVEPFEEAPADMTPTWPTFPKNYTTTDIKNEITKKIFQDSFKPPYKMDISQDLHEYVAFQEVPLFGAHFYYAFCPSETINHWHNFNNLKIPRDLLKTFEKLEEFQAQVLESPIKGRVSLQPKDRERIKAAKASVNPTEKAKPKKLKPVWEGNADEELIEAEPVKTTMIVLPADGVVKAIPEALRLRFEQSKKASLAKKAEQKTKTDARDKAPVGRKRGGRKNERGKPKTPEKQTSLHDKILGNTAPEAVEPVVFGPHFRDDTFRGTIKDIKSKTAEVAEYLKKAHEKKLEQQQEEEIDFGEHILGGFDRGEYSSVDSDPETFGAFDVDDLDEEFDDAISGLKFNATKARKQHASLYKETPRRKSPAKASMPDPFDELAEIAAKQAQAAAEQAAKQAEEEAAKQAEEEAKEKAKEEAKKEAKKFVKTIDNSTAATVKANKKLAAQKPTEGSEKDFRNNLVSNNKEFIDRAEKSRSRLEEAIETDDPNLPEVVEDTKDEFVDAVNKSNANDEKAAEAAEKSNVSLAIAAIQDQRNDSLIFQVKTIDELSFEIDEIDLDAQSIDFGEPSDANDILTDWNRLASEAAKTLPPSNYESIVDLAREGKDFEKPINESIIALGISTEEIEEALRNTQNPQEIEELTQALADIQKKRGIMEQVQSRRSN